MLPIGIDFLAQTAAAQPNPVMSFLPIILMFGIFYFLLIRPQQKKQKEHKNLIANLEKNQEVVTAGGVHGTVVGLKEHSVVLRIADNVKVEFDRSAIARVQAKAS